MSAEDWIDGYDPEWEYGYPSPPKETRHETSWMMRDGNSILIVDMDDRHLFNAYMATGDEELFQEMVLRLFERRMEPPKILFGGDM